MKKNKIITFILVTLPITSIYKSFIPMLSIADILLLYLAVIALITTCIPKKKGVPIVNYDKRTNHYGPLILMLFFVFTTLISMLVGDYFSLEEIFKRILRFGLFMFTVSITGYYYFDFKYGMRMITNISIFATVYIIIQTVVFYVFGKVLPFIIPILNPVVSVYSDISGLVNWYNQFYYRPQSIFMEPAHFSQYVLIALALCLYWKRISGEKTKINSAIFLSIGLVLSTSSIGIIMCMFIWGMYLLDYFKSKLTLRKVVLFFTLVILMSMSLPFIFDIELIRTSILRVFEATARTTGSYSLTSDLYFQQKLFGLGLGNEGFYLGFEDTTPFMNSFTIVILTTGYLGFVAYLLFFLNLIIKSTSVFRVLVISLFILSSVSEIFFAYIGILYLLFIYYGREKTLRDLA